MRTRNALSTALIISITTVMIVGLNPLQPAHATTSQVLYVSSFGSGVITKIDLGTGVASTIVTGLVGPEDGAVSPNTGKVYFPESFSGKIDQFNPDGSGLTSATLTIHPEGLSFDAAGNLFTNTRDGADGHLHEISGGNLANSPTTVSAFFSSFGEGSMIDKSGNLWAIDSSGGKVINFGTSFSSTNSGTVVVSGLIVPIGIAHDSTGRIYVSKVDGTILRFNPDGTGLTTFASLGFSNGAAYIEIDSGDNVYATEPFSGNVVKITQAGTVTTIASPGGIPVGLAISAPTVASTTTTITPNPSSVTYGNSITFTATVTDTSSSPTNPTGPVSWSVSSGGLILGSAGSCTLSPVSGSTSSSSCQLTGTPPTTAAAGSYTITGSYGGDSTHSSSSGTSALTLNKRTTTTTVTPNPSSVTAGSTITLTVTVADTDIGTSSIPTGPVTWNAGGAGGSFSSSGSCTLSSTGSCTIVYTASTTAGSATITGSYGGDSTHSSSSGTSALTINPAAPTQIVITSGAAQILSAGQVSGGVNWELRDQFNNRSPVTSSSGITYTLSTTSAGGQFGSGSSGNNLVGIFTSATLPQNAVGSAFLYKDTVSGTPTITVSAPGLTSATMVFLVNLLPPPPLLLTISGCCGSGPGQLAGPWGIALGSSGNIIVADSINNRIEIFNSAGTFLSTFGTTGSGPGQFQGAFGCSTSTFPCSSPAGIATDSLGNIYAVDNGNSRIEKFSPSGTFLMAFGTAGGGPGQFSNPSGVALDGSGNIYVADRFNGRIQIFNSAGTFLSAFGNVAGPGKLNQPGGVALDSLGNIYVADIVSSLSSIGGTGSGQVLKFNSAGTFLMQFGTPAQFSSPTAIALDGSGNVYVADTDNARFQVFNSAGGFLTAFGQGVITSFDHPRGITVDSLGKIYVSSFGLNQVKVFGPINADFGLLATNSVTATQGTTGSTTIQVTSLNGFSSAVSLSVLSGLPAGVTPSFGTNPVTPPSGGTASSLLTLNVGPTVIPGTYTITVQGSSGSIVHTTTFALTVNPSVPPGNFAISATSAVIIQGNNGPSTVTVTSQSGFSSPVTLSLQGQTNGITGSFAANPVTPSSGGIVSTTLTLNVPLSAPAQAYTLTVTGTSGSVSNTATLTLTVGAKGVTSIGPAQPIVLSSDQYQLESSGSVTVSDSADFLAGTPTVNAFVSSNSFGAGLLVTLSKSTTPNLYTSTSQVTFTAGLTDFSAKLYSSVSDKIRAVFPTTTSNPFYLRISATSLTTIPFANSGDIPIVGNWDGASGTATKITEIGVYRPSTGSFYERNNDGSLTSILSWAAGSDVPIVGDWTGDGTTKIGALEPSTGTFFLRNSVTSLTKISNWASAGDVPIVGNWDGASGTATKITEIGVYRPSTGSFYERNNDGSLTSILNWASAGDVPIVGDWTGAGKTSIGVYRPSTGSFYERNNDGSLTSILSWASAGDVPIVGNWDGAVALGTTNKITEVGVYRPSTGSFYERNNDGSLTSILSWASSGDAQLVGDWTGDGTTKIGVYRPVVGGNVATATMITNIVPTGGVAVSTGTNLACIGDSSKDGICDEWKTSSGVAIPINGVTYTFTCTSTATYTNDPLGDQVCPVVGTKDIYVEIDYMTGHKPDTTALTDVVNAFLNHGIHLHLQVDEDMALHQVSIPLTTTLDSNGNVVNTGFFGATGAKGFQNGYKNFFFGTATERADAKAVDLLTAKRQFYHFAMFIHNLSDIGTASGYGEIGGNDIIISLGSFTNGVGSIAEQEGTLIHELGHNFGLDHGGPLTILGTPVADHSLNCKPNYPSVMNYLYQLPALVSGRPLDFSSLTLTNTLDESNLVESSGIKETLSSTAWSAAIGGVDANNAYQPVITAKFDGSGIDYDRNTDTTGTISKNIHLFNIPNCDLNTNNVLTKLNGYDDWDNLNLEFRGSNTFANGLFTINQNDLNPTALTAIQTARIAQLERVIDSLPPSAFAPNDITFVQQTIHTDLVAVDTSITAPNLSDAIAKLQVLISTTGPGNDVTTLITDTPSRSTIVGIINDIINSLTAAATPAPGSDHKTPHVSDLAVTTFTNVQVGFKLSGADPNGLPLKYSTVTTPASGTISPPLTAGLDFGAFSTATYTPNKGFSGTDSFSFSLVNNAPTPLTSNTGTVTIKVIDNLGPITSGTTVSPNPVAINTAMTLSSTVDDTTTGGSKIASAQFSIDGGSPSAMTAVGTFGTAVIQPVFASITAFPTAGVHSICVTGTDTAGNTGAKDCTLLAVFDPSGGFVTGGGWINSPSGAYIPNLSATGKATFGFVSKYLPGATIPSGDTQFQFNAAGITFKSTSYQWLVISGPMAQYKGSGNLNGNSGFGFILTARDGDLVGTGTPDGFRLKITDSSGGVVYDNLMSSDDSMTSGNTQPISGGDIVIHKS